MAIHLLTPAFNVYEQMALDEVLVRADLPEPVLRFYHWTQGPAVTFGYAQFYADIQKQCPETAGPVCRRPTGGGIVFHGEDLTFSLVFESVWNRPKEIYARLHSAIEKALMQTGALYSSRQGQVTAQAYLPQQNGAATGCFVNPVEDDLLSGGQKILGGAIRRFGSKVLYQGSLQYEAARTDPSFRRAVQLGLAEALQVSFRTVPLEEDLLLKTRLLTQEQYKTDAWNQKF